MYQTQTDVLNIFDFVLVVKIFKNKNVHLQVPNIGSSERIGCNLQNIFY